MTYQEFISEIKKLSYEIPTPAKNPDPCQPSVRYSTIALWKNRPSLINAWHVGGKSGGSCWGGTPTSYTTGEPEPEWEALINILLHFCPAISYLQYRGMMLKVENDIESSNDYYGNETVYSLRILALDDLYQYLTDKKLLP